MPIYKFHLRLPSGVDADDIGLECRDLHHAYLQACQSMPDIARDLLIDGRDHVDCAFLICDEKGRTLMEVPFSELLSPGQWRLGQARRRPHGGVRSASARDDLALSSFRRMFASVDVGCVLLTPDLLVKDINAFGAKHSHVDRDAIRDTSILEAFDLSGEPRDNFGKFWSLAQRGAPSQLIDMPYLVRDPDGHSVHGWWNARVWPIFDDDDHLIGLVEWAEPFLTPSNGGHTLVRLSSAASA